MAKIVCPHCGGTSGFYTRERVTGTATIWYTENGDHALDQTDMYSTLQHSGGKKAYCSECQKYIGKSENLKTGNIEKAYYSD